MRKETAYDRTLAVEAYFGSLKEGWKNYIYTGEVPLGAVTDDAAAIDRIVKMLVTETASQIEPAPGDQGWLASVCLGGQEAYGVVRFYERPLVGLEDAHGNHHCGLLADFRMDFANEYKLRVNAARNLVEQLAKVLRGA